MNSFKKLSWILTSSTCQLIFLLDKLINWTQCMRNGELEKLKELLFFLYWYICVRGQVLFQVIKRVATYQRGSPLRIINFYLCYQEMQTSMIRSCQGRDGSGLGLGGLESGLGQMKSLGIGILWVVVVQILVQGYRQLDGYEVEEIICQYFYFRILSTSFSL